MKLTAPLILSILALLPLAGSDEGASSQSDLSGAEPVDSGNGGSIDWTRSYSRAVAEARETGKPIFLEFRCRP